MSVEWDALPNPSQDGPPSNMRDVGGWEGEVEGKLLPRLVPHRGLRILLAVSLSVS